MDYVEMYRTYKEIGEFIYDHYGDGMGISVCQWEIAPDGLLIQFEYETDCDAGCGYHYSDVTIPLDDFRAAFNKYKDNKKADP